MLRLRVSDPDGPLSGRDEKGREWGQNKGSRRRVTTGFQLVRKSPFVNMAGDALSGSSDCLSRRRGGEHG
jgi:hypothetical protein